MKVCNKQVGKKQMQRHVGKHILDDKLDNVCGFCGTQGCSIELAKSSGWGATANKGPNCPTARVSTNFHWNQQRSQPSLAHAKCPISCAICQVVVWSYSIDGHYNQIHQGVAPPSMVSDEETDVVFHCIPVKN